MKKTRRIEITAFRRQVIIHPGDKQRIDSKFPSVSGDELPRDINGTVQLTRVDAEEGSPAPPGAAHVDELALLVEALRDSEDNNSVAAEQLDPGRNDCRSRLLDWAFRLNK